jgi:HSP20 family molecular chaperone IbpA
MKISNFDNTFGYINKCINNDWNHWGTELLKPLTQAKDYNLEKRDNGYQLQVLAVGFEKNELTILSEGSYITIRGEKTDGNTFDGLIHKSLSKSILVGGDIDTENIEAELRNGILFIDVPLKEKRNKIIIK